MYTDAGSNGQGTVLCRNNQACVLQPVTNLRFPDGETLE
jgi:hypothetical protein